MNYNARTEVLRTSNMNQPQMLGLNGPSLIQNTPQPPPAVMGLPPNAAGGHPNMAMMPGNSNPSMVGQRYPMQPNSAMLPGQARLAMRQAPGPSHMNAPGPGNPHMGNPALNGLGFAGNMMPPGGGNPQMRRAVSQPQNNMGHGLPPGVNGNMGMGMNPSASVPPQMRPQQHPQQPGQHPIRPMGPEMMMNRPGPNGNMGPGVQRPAPLMSSLGQPGGMPSHQNNFPNSIGMPHQPPQLSSSPRPGVHGPGHNPSMSIGAPGPSQPPMNRARMTPDNNNFMSFGNPNPNSPFPPGSRMSGNNNYPMVPSTPPNHDMSQSISGSNNTPNRPGPGSGFMPTPAQQFEHMRGSEPFNPFGDGIPPRPPSHNTNPSHPPQPPPSQPSHHASPHSSDLMNIYPPTRPQSQPQNQQNQSARPSSRTGPSQTPRPSQQQQQPHPSQHPPGPPGRIPPGPQPGPSNNNHHNQMRPPSTTGVSQPGPPPIAPRPPTQPQPPQSQQQPPHPPASSSTNAETSPRTSSSSSPSDQQQQLQSSQPIASTSAAVPIPRAVPNNMMSTPALGHGVGLIRLLQFSGILANESKQKLQLSWWNELMREYFTPKAIMRFTLWKDNQRNEAKPFEIGVPILPRFFLVTTQSGVKSMTLTLDGARERLYAYGHAIVECVSAVWTYKYNNGYTVALRGPLTVHVVLTAPPPTAHPHGPGQGNTQNNNGNYLLKFEDFQFDAMVHDKFIALESISGPRTLVDSPRTPRSRLPGPPGMNGMMEDMGMQQEDQQDVKWDEPRVMIERGYIPGEPVNAFGIPQATMRCLELAESVAQMSDLISFSYDNHLGPKESLTRMAQKIRDTMPMTLTQPLGQPPGMVNGHQLGAFGMSNVHFNGIGGTGMPGSGVGSATLYTSAPASVTNPNSSVTHIHSQGATPSTMTSSPQNLPQSANSSPRKGHKTIPGQQGQQPGSGSATTPNSGSAQASGSASTPGSSSTTNTPALGKRKISESPAQANADPQGPPSKRTTRGTKRGRTNGSG